VLQLIVLYPQPAGVKQFEADYVIHTKLRHGKKGVTAGLYTITKFLPAPDGSAAPFYRGVYIAF
jgi:hypothetical protein